MSVLPAPCISLNTAAVLTGRSERLDWHQLEDTERWQMGWK